MGIIYREQSLQNDTDMAGCFPGSQSRGKIKSLILFTGLLLIAQEPCSGHRSGSLEQDELLLILKENHYSLGKQTKLSPVLLFSTKKMER